VPAEEGEKAFRQCLPRAAIKGADQERYWQFIKECRAVMKLTCRLNKVRYSAAISNKYLNDERVVVEALRRMRQKSKL
jgi:hypothetical protein